MTPPAIVKILSVFTAMLLLTRLRVPLGAALVAGGLALSAWAGFGAAEVAAHLGRAVTDPELWLLLAITVLIIDFGRYVTREGNGDQIVAVTRRWGGRHGRTATLIALPAVIGLIPMPGGALFSAPFVQKAGEPAALEAPLKTALNYWFRHVWEYWWPLYPGVIVAMSLFEMEAWRFIAAQIAYTPVAVAAGYLFLVRRHVARLARIETAAHGDSLRALVVLSPLLVVIAAVFAVPPLLGTHLAGLPTAVQKMLAVLIGLLAGLVILLVDEARQGWEPGNRPFSSLRRAKSLNVLFTLTGVILFKSFLEQSGLLPEAGRELARTGIPLAAAVAVLPLLAGLVTGIALGFTGVAFPLVVGLMAAEGSGLTPLATLVLAYGFGYMGMMLSPVHLCLLVSRDYFGSSLPQVYRLLAPCAAAILCCSVLLHICFRLLGW